MTSFSATTRPLISPRFGDAQYNESIPEETRADPLAIVDDHDPIDINEKGVIVRPVSNAATSSEGSGGILLGRSAVENKT